jgi:hypothetical protein
MTGDPLEHIPYGRGLKPADAIAVFDGPTAALSCREALSASCGACLRLDPHRHILALDGVT